MHPYQYDFIHYAVERNVLRFGDFTLKSGRQSPYFFNAGEFNTGKDLQMLGQSYSAAINDTNLAFDVLYGPAYKGIPLAAATAIAMSHQKDVPYAYNRKEAKTHGEGGQLVGANLQQQRVLVIDDVITAGTAIRESITLLKSAEAIFSGVVVALDRQERGQGLASAIQEVEEQYNVPVVSIVSFDNIITYLQQHHRFDEAELMQAYHEQYGVKV
jgi:orotate phosphoribosyltransferase